MKTPFLYLSTIAAILLAGCDMPAADDGPERAASGSAEKSGKVRENSGVEGVQSAEGAPEESSPPAPEPSASAAATATAKTTENGSAKSQSESREDGARTVSETSELFDFEYAYPKEVGKNIALRGVLDADLEKRREELKTDALEARSDADDNGFPYNAYSVNVTWETEADLFGWLSLSKLEWTYSGGAHGNSVFGSMLWDRKRDRMVAPVTMFTSPAALTKAVSEPFCAALNKQRAKKRGTPVAADSDEIFDECIDPAKSGALVPASTNGRTFNRLTFLIPPYAAGPYAEGSYEVTLPVTQAVMSAVKPEYRAAFSKAN